MKRALIALACLSLLAPPAAAETEKAARVAAARAAALAEQQVQAAAALRQLEDQTGAAAQRLSDIQAAQAATAQQLTAAQHALAKLLPVLQRLTAEPGGTLLAVPQTPQEAVTAAAIVQGIARGIAAQADQVQQAAAQQASLLAAAQAAQAQLNAAIAAQQASEAELTRQIQAAKGAEMAEADAGAAAAAAKLASQAQLGTLSEAANQLVPPGSGSGTALVAGGGPPVAGKVIQAFGAQTLAGPATGVSYGAVPGARVTTPCAGTVMFAGPFPNYGQMVIADCGQGASVVLAGMSELDVAAGERLADGQPVGSMQPPAAGGSHAPVLYVELRQNGKPVDPTKWLTGHHSS